MTKVETATEKRFASGDEFRQTLRDQTRSLVSKVEFDAVRDSGAVRIADLASRLDKTEGNAAGLDAGWVYPIRGPSVAATLASLVVLVVQWPTPIQRQDRSAL